MMKTIIAIFAFLMLACSPKSVKVTVTNPTDTDRRGEMVEIPLEKLGFAKAAQFMVKNCEGTEIPSQLTYDGKLIFQADVNAGEKSVYSVGATAPVSYTTYVCGRVYPERVDDLAWESDLIAFRIYGPALQATGERAFGNDVWIKNNTDLPVVEARYATELNPQTRAKIAELKKTDKKAAKELANSISYHIDHGNGFDPYKVGPTLGAGGSALIADGELVYPYCYADCKVLDNGPLRFTAEVSYRPAVIGGKEVIEHRIISIDKGSYLNRTTVWYEGLEGENEIFSGIVLHEEDGGLSEVDNESLYVGHVDPIAGDKTAVGEIYLGMVFPRQWESAGNRLFSDEEQKTSKAYGHVGALNKLSAAEPLTYYWGAAWSKATVLPVADFAAWNAYLKGFSAKLAAPLVVKVK